jgi:hypothetical protein
MRAALVPEAVAPLLAVATAIAAAAVGWPPILALLAAIWFLPSLIERLGGSTLDEREAAIRDRAERLGLRSMLVLVCCALPVLILSPTPTETSFWREWADVGFLLVLPFLIRALYFAGATMPTARAAQVAGAYAAVAAALLAIGTLLVRPGFSSPVVLAVALLPLLPHFAVTRVPRVAGTLWLLGGAAVTVHALSSGLIPIEVAVALALLALPWGVAGWWALRGVSPA